jgi:hypothetical protein
MLSQARNLSLVLCLSGCASPQSLGWDKGASQPRALFHSVTLPNCIFFCTVTLSVNESEKSSGNLTSGDLKTEISPQLSVGLPNAPKVEVPKNEPTSP